MMASNLASRLLGLGREAVVVGLFGLSAATSAFVTASTVPTMVFDLLIGGAISAALIPVLADHLEDQRAFGRVAGALLALTVAAMLVVVLLLEAAAPWVAAALGAAMRPEVEAETVRMLRVMLPSVVLLGAAGVVQAVLQARGMFGYTALSAAGFNLGIIVSGVALAAWLGPVSLAVGVLLGAALQLATQLPGLRGVPLRWKLDLAEPGVRRALKLYAPVAAGLVVSQIGIAIDRYLAWQTGDASIALMRSATTLVQLPLGLVATATSFAVLPVLARQGPEFRATLAFGVRVALLAIVPATVGLLLLREPVVRLLFERGAFGPADTALTALAFVWYAPQMPFWAVDQLLIFAFYARKDTVTPVLVGLFGTVLYLAVALVTVVPLGVFGLILANTVQNSLHCVVMYLLLVRVGQGLGGVGLGAALLRAVGGAIALCGAYGVVVLGLGTAPTDAIANASWLAVAAVCMAAAVVGALAVMRTPELVDGWRAVVERARRLAG